MEQNNQNYKQSNTNNCEKSLDEFPKEFIKEKRSKNAFYLTDLARQGIKFKFHQKYVS